MVTIKDVAKRAGVNPSTVSRSLKDSSSISEKTKAKVRQAMEELGYVPNVAASQLASDLTHSVGVVFPPMTLPDRLSQPFFMEILAAINAEAQSRRFSVAIATASSTEDLEKQVALMHKQRLVDGFVVLYSQSNDPVSHYLHEQEIPFVVVGQAQKVASQRTFVDNDNQAMGYEAVTHLQEKGHERLLFVTDDLNSTIYQSRYDGFKRGLIDFGLLSTGSALFDRRQPETLSSLVSTIQEQAITAIVVIDDMTAIRVMQLLSYYDLKVPDDISILSFNNSIYTTLIHPYLTSFDIGVSRLGESSLSALLDRIESQEVQAETILVPFELQERESVRNLRKR